MKKSRKDDIVKSFRKQNKNLLQKLRASERKLADREKCDKIKALLNTMSGFISKSLSTSSAHANTSAFKLANASICSVDAILAQENIPLLLPLTAEELHDFCEQVKHKLDNKKSDTKGIHPQVVDIFKACVCPAANFVILHETIIRDMEKRPDISLVMRTNVKKNIESVVVPTEIKKLKDLKNAIVQALGYLASKMLNVLDTVGFEQKIFGYCLGTDGLQLSVGYFAIENYEVKVLMTKYENADCPLLPSKFRPGEKETYPR